MPMLRALLKTLWNHGGYVRFHFQILAIGRIFNSGVVTKGKYGNCSRKVGLGVVTSVERRWQDRPLSPEI